jgi:hypothetical protein
MDEPYRIKIKIGPHEFEAEGPVEVVQEQFRLFKEMIVTVPPSIPETPKTRGNGPIPETRPYSNLVDDSLHKVMKFDQDERVVSLTVRPKSVEDAVLLILFGQKEMLSNEAVTGGAIMEGLTATGGLSISRVDRLFEEVGKAGDVIVIGEHRSKRYRLTNAGVNRAREIAEQLIFLVP